MAWWSSIENLVECDLDLVGFRPPLATAGGRIPWGLVPILSGLRLSGVDLVDSRSASKARDFVSSNWLGVVLRIGVCVSTTPADDCKPTNTHTAQLVRDL